MHDAVGLELGDGSGNGRPLQVAGVAYRRDLPGDWAGLRPYWLLAASGSAPIPPDLIDA